MQYVTVQWRVSIYDHGSTTVIQHVWAELFTKFNYLIHLIYYFYIFIFATKTGSFDFCVE